MINWHLEPRSRRLLAKLNRGNTERVTRAAIPADYHDYVGADKDARRVLKALEARRTRAIEFHLGCDFKTACSDTSRHGEIMAVLEAAPDVSVAVAQVLACDGYPISQAVPFGQSHPDSGRGFRVGGVQ